MKQLSKNIIVALFTKILLIVSGIVAQRFILKTFGSDVNGLTSAVSQFLTYFTLLESGLGLASIQALYKPLAENDQDKISSILAATSEQYKKIGLIFLSLTLVLSVAMPWISHSSLDPWIVVGITILMGLGNVLNYLYIGRYNALLSADRRIYVIHTLDAILGISFSFIRIFLINAGCTIIAVQMVALLSPTLRILFLHFYVSKNYPYVNYRAQPDRRAIGKRKYVLVHQIVGMVTTHTDITILTLFSTLSHVSVYAVYNLIYSNITNVVSTAFSSAAQASFGRLLERKDNRLLPYYTFYETAYTFLLFCLLSAVFVMTIPFVSLYTDGVSGINYVDPILALLFMISILFNTVRIPALTMVNATGRFKETQRGAVIEAIINIGISLPAFFSIGMRGLLIGTCVAMFYRAIDLQLYVYKHILYKKISKWFGMILINSAIMAVVILFFGYVYRIVTPNWISWLIAGIKSSVIIFSLFLIVFSVIYRKKVKEVLVLLKNYKN